MKSLLIIMLFAAAVSSSVPTVTPSATPTSTETPCNLKCGDPRCQSMCESIESIAQDKPVPGWYIPVFPPFGGPSFNIGPYPNLHDCNDMDGSFIFKHPGDCHVNGTDCGVIGNGIAYPLGMFPYPPAAENNPATRIMGGCFFSKTIVPQPDGNYFFEYHALPTPGGSAQECGKFAKFKALQASDPTHYRVARVHDACGGKCFPMRYDNACE